MLEQQFSGEGEKIEKKTKIKFIEKADRKISALHRIIATFTEILRYQLVCLAMHVLPYPGFTSRITLVLYHVSRTENFFNKNISKFRKSR